jgi:hypothetical protein
MPTVPDAVTAGEGIHCEHTLEQVSSAEMGRDEEQRERGPLRGIIALMPRGLAELHVHQYGDITWDDYLAHLSGADVDWSFYEEQFEAAYGAVPPIRDILRRHDQGEAAAREAFRELFVFGDADAGNFQRFQAKFNLLVIGSVFSRMHTLDDPVPALAEELVGFTRRMLAGQRRAGVGYAERRLMVDFEPDRSRALHAALLDCYRRESDAGLTARHAVSLQRADPWPQWEVVKELALGPDGDFLTGVDFCFVEEGHPPRNKADFFGAVQDFNREHPKRALAILYHVGESFTDKSLESAVRWVQEAAELGAHRLGHAIALGVEPDAYGPHERRETVAERRDQLAYDRAHAEDLRHHGVPVDHATIDRELAELADSPADRELTHRYDAERLDQVRRRQDYAMGRVRATGAVIEVCPTSNRRIGNIADPAHHPVRRFLEANLPVVVASDDPGIFDTTLAEELAWVGRTAGLEEGALIDLANAAWRHRSEVLTGRVRP